MISFVPMKENASKRSKSLTENHCNCLIERHVHEHEPFPPDVERISLRSFFCVHFPIDQHLSFVCFFVRLIVVICLINLDQSIVLLLLHLIDFTLDERIGSLDRSGE